MARRRYNHTISWSYLDDLNELYNRAVINGISNYRYNIYYDYGTSNLEYDGTNQTAYTTQTATGSNNQ